MNKNQISVLPTYIGKMNDLVILKLDHNPITFPPGEVMESDIADRCEWLEGIKQFLRDHEGEGGEEGGEQEEIWGKEVEEEEEEELSMSQSAEPEPSRFRKGWGTFKLTFRRSRKEELPRQSIYSSRDAVHGL